MWCLCLLVKGFVEECVGQVVEGWTLADAWPTCFCMACIVLARWVMRKAARAFLHTAELILHSRPLRGAFENVAGITHSCSAEDKAPVTATLVVPLSLSLFHEVVRQQHLPAALLLRVWLGSVRFRLWHTLWHPGKRDCSCTVANTV